MNRLPSTSFPYSTSSGGPSRRSRSRQYSRCAHRGVGWVGWVGERRCSAEDPIPACQPAETAAKQQRPPTDARIGNGRRRQGQRRRGRAALRGAGQPTSMSRAGKPPCRPPKRLAAAAQAASWNSRSPYRLPCRHRQEGGQSRWACSPPHAARTAAGCAVAHLACGAPRGVNNPPSRQARQAQQRCGGGALQGQPLPRRHPAGSATPAFSPSLQQPIVPRTQTTLLLRMRAPLQPRILTYWKVTPPEKSSQGASRTACCRVWNLKAGS